MRILEELGYGCFRVRDGTFGDGIWCYHFEKAPHHSIWTQWLLLGGFQTSLFSNPVSLASKIARLECLYV